MRSYEDHRKILELWEQGHNKFRIAKMTGIPRPTIRDTIKRYGSVANLEAARNSNDTPGNISPESARQILELWEQGHSKQNIIAVTGFSKYIVVTCIEQYRSISQLENAIQNGETFSENITPKEHYRASVPRYGIYSEEELREAVRTSISLAETLRTLGVRPAGGNYATLRNRIQELGLDTSHFRGQGWAKGEEPHVVSRKPLKDILVENSTYTSTNDLRRRLLNEGYFERVCVECELREWRGHPIPLELDHINGIRRDNRIENLRLLCPNCHALTETYRGKNIRVNEKG